MKYIEKGILIRTIEGTPAVIGIDEAQAVCNLINHHKLLNEVRQAITSMECSKEIELAKVTERDIKEICEEYTDVLENDTNKQYALDDIIYGYFYKQNADTAESIDKGEDNTEQGKTFVATIEETCTGKVTLQAKDEDEAEKVAKKLYEDGAVPIDTLVEKLIMIMNEGEDESSTDWCPF